MAFTGDECLTMKRTQDVLDLHEQLRTQTLRSCLSNTIWFRFFEPLAKEVNSIEKILEGQPVKKIVLISDPDAIRDVIQPHWNAGLNGTGAVTTMAVTNMLELIPQGVNKWIGLHALLKSMKEWAEVAAARARQTVVGAAE